MPTGHIEQPGVLTEAYRDALGTSTFQGRLQRDNATQISLARFKGNFVDVLGELVQIGAAGLIRTAAQNLITATGADAGVAMAVSTLYYVYVSNSLATFSPSSIRASATAPTRKTTGLHQGIYYLADAGNGANWRFVGWVRTDATGPNGNFVDSITSRLVVNYYNRLSAALYSVPGYVDDNLDTSWTTISTTWTPANGGTGSQLAFIANGEDSIAYSYAAYVNSSVAAYPAIGVGENTTAGPVTRSRAHVNALNETRALAGGRTYTPTVGYVTLNLLVMTNTGTATFVADEARNGATADPAETYISAELFI